MSCTPTLFDKRPLKKPKLGPPDIYPQDIKQKEDDLSALNVKQGYYEHFNNIDEYGSNKSLKILHEALLLSFNNILKRKRDLNTPLDNSKKKLLLNIKDIFWPATARSKVSVDIWFKDLAANKPLNNLAKKVPIFNKKEELIMQLYETNIPIQRACWIIKLHAAHTSVIAENKIKKRQIIDPCYEWTQTFCKILKELAHRLNYLIKKNKDAINEYSKLNLTNNDLEKDDAHTIIGMANYINNTSTYSNSGFVAHQPDQQQQLPNYLTSNLATTFQIWNYLDSLVYYIFKERLLDNQEFTMFLCDLLEKPADKLEVMLTYEELYDSSFDFLLPLVLKYIDCITQSYFCSRRLAFFCAQFLKRYYLKSSLHQLESTNEENINNQSSGTNGYIIKSKTTTDHQDAVRDFQNFDKMLFLIKYHDCPKHRNIILNLSQIIQMITLKCPSALVWNGVWKWSMALNAQNLYQENPACFKNSPLDFLPFTPSELPIQTYDGNAIQLKEILYQMEEGIAKRSSMADHLWSLPYENKNKYFTTTNVINMVIEVLEALDHYDYNKCDKGNDTKHLYQKIYCLNEPYYQDKPFDDNVEMLCKNEEPILNTICQWAITLQRSGSYRPIVAAHMLGMRLRHLQDILIQNDKLCQRRIAVSAESGATTAEDNNVLIDEAERETFYKSQSRLVIQKLLINFLDLYAPTLKDLQDENLELFTSLIILFGEFIRGGIFNYDSYVKFLICRGDVDVSHLQEPLWAHACFNKTKKLLTRNLSKPVDLLSDVSTADFIYPFATTCLTTTTTMNDEYEQQLLQRQMLLTTTSNLQGSGTGAYFRPNKKTTIFKKNMLFSVHYQYLYHFPVADHKDDIISRLKALFGISFYKSRVESNLKQLYKLLLVHPVVKKNTTTITTRANKGSPDPGAASDINFSRVQRYLKAIYLTFPICDQWLLSGKCLRSIVKALRKFVISRRHPLDDKVLIVKGHPIPTLGPQQQLLLLPRLETIAFYYDLAACSGNHGAIVTSASDTLLELSNVYRHIACTLATADIPSPDDNKNYSEDLTFFLVDWQFYTVKLAVLLIGHLKLLQPYLVTYSQLDSSNHRVSFSPADTDSNDGGLRQHIATDDTGIHRIFRAILVFCREVGEIPQGACSYFRTLYSFLYDLYVSCSLLRDVSSNKELLENSIVLISEIKKSMYSIVAPTPPPPPSFHHQVQAQAAHHQPGGAAGLLLGGGSGGTSQLAAATAASWWDPFFLTPFLRSWSQVNLDEHPNPHSSNGTLLYVSKFDSYGIISSIDRELSSLSSSGGNNCSSSSILLQLEQHPSKRYSFVCNALIALLRRILSETEWLDDKRYLTPICLNGGGGGNIRHALQTPPLPLPSEEILLLPLAKYARVHYRTLRDLRVYVKFAVEISCQYQHPKFLKGGQNEGGDHTATKSLVGGAGLPKSEMTFHERIMTYQTEVGDADDRKLLPPMSLDYLPSSSSFTTTSCIQPAITAGAPLLNGEWLGAFKALCCPTHHMHHQHTLLQHPHHPTLPPSLIGGGAMPESPLPDSPATFTSTTIASLIFGNHNFVTVSRNAIKLFSDTGRLDKLMLLYDCLGVLCLSLILRHIFSLEDFIKHVALPSLLAAACPPAAAPLVISPPSSLPIPQTSPSPISNSNNKDTGPTTETTTSYVRFNRVLKDKPAESGARLTCFLLYRLFKSFPPTYLDGSLTSNNVVAGEGGTNFDPNIPPLSLLPIVKESTFLDIGRTLIEDRSKWLATASTTDLSASIHTAAATAPNPATHPALNLVGEGEDEEEDDDLKTALTGLDDNPVLGVTDEQLVVVEGGNPNEEFKYLGYVAEDMSGDEEDNHKDYLNPALKHTSTTYNNNNNLKGRFTGFNTTPGSSASCFSYTSLFEQLPSTTSKSQINTENKDFPPFAFSSFAGVFQEVYEKQNLLAHQHNISIGALLAVFKALILTSSLQHVTNEGDDPELSESANFGTGAKKRKGGTPRKKNLQQYETTPNYKKTYPYSSSRGSNLYPPHPSSPYAEYEETGEMLSFRFNRFSQEVLLVLTHQPWVKELFLKDPDGICSDQLLLDPLLSHKQASKLLHLICYPEGLPSIPKHFFFHKDHRSEIKSHVARILCNLDPFNLRVSYLELQLAIKQQVREQDLNVLYDVISRVTIQIFQQRNQFTNDNVPIRYRKKSIISLLYRSTSFLDFFPAAAAAAAAKLNHHNPEYLPAAYHHRQQQQQLKQNNNNNNKSSNKNNLLYLNNNNETDNTSTSTSTTNKNKGKRTASSLNASSTLTSTINSSNKRRKRGRPPLNSAAATCSAPPPPSNVSGHLNEKNKKLGAATTLKNSPKPPTTTAHNAASASTLLTSPFSQSCAAEDFAVSGGQDEDYDSSSSLDSFPFLGSSSGQQYAADDDDDFQPKFNEEDNRLLLLNQEDNDNCGHAALTEYDLAFGAGSGPLSNVTALDGGCFTGGGNYASPLTPAALNSIESSSMTNNNNNNNINDGVNLLLSSSTTNYNNYTSPARKKAAVAANQATLRRWNAEKKRRRKQSVWFVAPLVAKLSKGIQGRVLKYAGQILESGSTQHWATSSLNKLEREKCTQRSASLLTHKPFLFLLKTCLARHKSLFSRRFYRSTYVFHVDGRTETALNAAATELYGTSDQRLYLLAAVHSQIAQILKNANEDRHILLLPENMKARNEIRKGLTLRLSLVADMCDLIIKAFSNVSPLPLGSMNLYAASGGMGSSGVGGGNTSGYNSSYLSSGGGNGTPNSMLGGGGAFGLVDYFGGSGSSAAQLGNNNQLGLDWASLLFQILTNDIVMNNIDGSFLDSEVEESCLLESSSDNDDTGELSSAGEEPNCNNSTSLAAMDHNEISLQHTKRIGKSTGTSSAIYPPPIGFNRAVASTSYYRHDNWDRGTDSFNYNENCTRLFYTVFDMLTTVVLASQMNLSFSHQHPPTFTTRRDSENDLENESSDDGGGYTIATGNVNFVQLDDSQKKSYHTFCKKLKKEILDKYESPKGEPLRILFPFGRSFEKIIIFDQFLDKHDRNQFLGLRASDSVNVNPWEMIEGLPKSVGTGVINPAWWQIHKTTAFKPLSYYEEYGNLQLHTHHHHEGGGSAAPGAKFFEEARSSIPETLEEEEAEEDYALDTWQDDIDYDIDFAQPPVGLPDRSPPILPPSNGGGKGDTPPLILLSPPPLNNNATMAVLTPRSIGGSSQAAFINAILSPPQNLLGGNQVVPPSSSTDFSQQQLTPHSTPSNKGPGVSPFPKSSQSQTMVMGVTSDGRERLLGRGDEQYPTTNFMISGVDGSHQSLLDRRYNTNTPFPPPPSYTTNTKAGPDRMILTASSQQHMDFMPLGSNSNLLRFGSSQHLIPNRTNLAPYNVGNNPHHPSMGSSLYHVTGNGNLIMNEINLLNKPPPPDQISISNLNPNSTNALTGGTPAVAAATKKTTKPRKKRAPKTTQASTTKGQNKVSGSKQNAASNQSAAAAAAAQQHLEQQNAFLTGSTAAASAQGQASSAAGLMYRMQQQQQRLPSGGNSQSSQNYQRFPPSQFLPPHYLQQQQDAQHAHLQSLKKVPENVSAPSAPTGKKKNAGSNNKSAAVPPNPSAAVASSSQPQMAAAANIYNYEDGGLSSLHHNQSLTGSSTSNMDPKAALSSMLRARNMTGTPGGDISLGSGGGGGGQLYPSNQLQQQQRYTGPPAANHHSIPPHTPSSVSASTLNYEQQQQQSSLTHLQQQQQTKYASYHQEETGVGGNNNMQQQQQMQPHLLLKHNTIIPNQQQQPPPPGYHNHDNNNPNAYPPSFFGNVPQQLMTAQQQQVNNNPQRRQMMMMTTQQQQQAYQQQQQPAGTNLLTNQQQQNLKINIAAAPSGNKAANTKNIFDHFDFDNEENAKVHVPPPPTFQASSSSRLHSNEKQRKVPSQMLLSQQQQQYQQHSAASYAAKNQQQLIQSTTNYSNNNNNNQMPPQSVRRPPPYSSASTIISTPSSSSSSSLQKAQQDQQQQQQYMQQMIQSNSTTASIGGGGPKSMMMTGQQQLLHHSNKNYNPLSSGGAGSSNIYHQHQNPQMINPNSTAQSSQQQQRYPLSQPPGGTNTGISQQQQQMSSGSNWNTAVVPPQSNNYSHNNLISYPGGSSSIRPAPQQFINTQSYNTPYALQSSYRPLASGGSGNSSENLYSQQQQQAMYRYNTMQQQQHLNNTAVIGSTNGGGSGGYPADNAASFQQQQQIPLENQQFSQGQPNSSNSRPPYPGFYGTQTHP